MPFGHGRKRFAALRAIAAGVALLACGPHAFALSSGAPRGTPLIGRPLQLSIPVTWDRSQEAPCVRAEFLQGESPGGPLRWRIDRTAEGSGLLRLTSSMPVQEPMVTVQVAIGCGEQFAREYVLLAELPNEARDAQAIADAGPDLPVALAPLPLAAARELASAGASAARMPATEAGAPPRQRAVAAATPAPRPRATSHRSRPQHRAAATQLASATPAAPVHRRTGPRLKLEPIDIAIDEAPLLRLTSALAPAAAGAPGGLAKVEARALWQALNTSPEERAAQAETAIALQREIKSMRELVQRYGAESRAATLRLEKVSAERDLILHGLLGLVVLLGGGLGYVLWLRSRDTAALRRWWEDEQDERPIARSAKPAAAPVLRTEPGVAPAATAAASAPAPQAAAQPEPAGDLVDLPDFLALEEKRVLTAEELLGLQERTDFFLAVGQSDKALHLLESQLQEHTGSPLIWLDLLDLCRRLGRREDHERLRVAFQKLFAVPVPAFDEALPPSGGLEAHQHALAPIVQMWGTPGVLRAIEDALFEAPKPGSVPFDLEASRDLLLLHGIATDVLAAPARHEVPGGVFPATLPAPLQAVPPPAVPAAAAVVDLPDIDLAGLEPQLHDDFDFSLSLPGAAKEPAA